MRGKVVRTLALALVLGGIGIALGQQPAGGGGQPRIDPPPGIGPTKPKPPAEKKSKLEEMLAEALKNNADIRVAVAKLAEAEAELNRTRVEVMQKVVTLHQAILSQKAMVALSQKQFDRYKSLQTERAIDTKLVDEQSAKLTVAKAKLAELEAQIPGLLGKTARLKSNPEASEIPSEIKRARLIRELSRAALETRCRTMGPLAERIRKALQTPVKVDYKDKSSTDVFTDLEKKVPGLSIRGFPQGGEVYFTVNLRFEEALPVSAILQALEDSYEVRFIVRDYGILITSQRNKPPPGALTVEEFLRQKPAEK